MQHVWVVDKDTIGVLLTYLLPKEALTLRATCRHFNKLIAHSQLYWYHKYNNLIGHSLPSQLAHPNQRIIHCKPFTAACLRHRWTKAAEWCFKAHPDTRVEYENIVFQLKEADRQRVQHNPAVLAPMPEWSIQNAASEKFCLNHMHLLVENAAELCGTLSHSTLIHGDPNDRSQHVDPRTQLFRVTQEFQNENNVDTNGLYMYHYLITKYRKTRERMQRTTPETAQRNAASLRQEIAALREEIREKSQRLRVFERYNQLEERMNQNTVFMRMKPETYHKKPMIRKSFGLVTAQKKKKTDDLDLERDD